jgi:hypothetical protein
MNLNRQQTEILAILKEKGISGMNSYEWRMRFIQLPVRIKELKTKGYLITTKTLKNRSVNYILVDSSIESKTLASTVTTQSPIQPWLKEDNRIRVVHASGRVTFEEPDYYEQKGLGI